MTKFEKFRIGMCLNNIGMMVDEATLQKLKPQLEEIEQIVAQETDDDDDGK